MPSASTALVSLDLLGTLAFAINGAMTAVRTARLDIVGIVTLGMMTALGGGFIRDILLDDLPPTTFLDGRYLAVAALGGLIAFVLGQRLEKLATPINVLDAAEDDRLRRAEPPLEAFERSGDGEEAEPGGVTAVGGGTLRDVMVRQVPAVLHSGLYAVPALIAAGLTAAFDAGGLPLLPWTVVAAAVCFAVRLLGVRYDLHAPRPRDMKSRD
jgi:uncharacterized membrane protein YeiH